MTNNGKGSRPLEGLALERILKELALVDAIAGSLKLSLEPLSDDDRTAGAEPLTPKQIQDDLDEMMRIITGIVFLHLKAESSEWYAATDAIE